MRQLDRSQLFHCLSFLLLIMPRPGRKEPVRRKPQPKKTVTLRHDVYSRILSWIASIPPPDNLPDPELISGNAQTPTEERGPSGKRRRTADTMNKDLRRSNRMQNTPDKWQVQGLLWKLQSSDGMDMGAKGESNLIQHTPPSTISIGTTPPGSNRSLGPASLRAALESAVPYHFKFNGTTGMPAEVDALVEKVRPNDYNQDVVPRDIKVPSTYSITRSF